MKNLFLLAAAAGFAMSANAQVSAPAKAGRMDLPTYPGIEKVSYKAGHKATASHSYWFGFVDANMTPSSKGALYRIYNDSTLYVPLGTPTPFYWYLHGLGVSFDPASLSFTPPFINTSILPADQPDFTITNSDSYTVDSIVIAGRYTRKDYNAFTDTLNVYIALAGGTPVATGTAKFGFKNVYYHDNLSIPDSTIHYANMVYDSVTNSILPSQVPGVIKIPVPLDDAALADSTSNGLHIWTLPLPTALNATPGQKVVVYEQFVPGNGGYHFGIDIDSVNIWSVLTYQINGDGGGTGTFPTQLKNDYNAGLLTTSRSRYDIGGEALIVGGKHYMNTTYDYGKAAAFDDPYVMFHINCSGCAGLSVPATFGNAGEVKAYPNPAASQLSVEFSLNSKADAVVSLQNILGEIVAVQTVKNSKDGKVVFNTSALPSGMYMFGVSANGQRSTGRVTIAH